LQPVVSPARGADTQRHAQKQHTCAKQTGGQGQLEGYATSTHTHARTTHMVASQLRKKAGKGVGGPQLGGYGQVTVGWWVGGGHYCWGAREGHGTYHGDARPVWVARGVCAQNSPRGYGRARGGCCVGAERRMPRAAGNKGAGWGGSGRRGRGVTGPLPPRQAQAHPKRPGCRGGAAGPRDGCQHT
jgi:hypothetical protein